MLTPKILEKLGLGPKALKTYFTQKTPSKKQEDLNALIRNRIADGMGVCFRNHRIWWALDKAYDSPFNQVTYTLVSNILDGAPDKSGEDVMRAISDWQLDSMITTEPCKTCSGECACGSKQKRLDLPVFFNIFFPLVKAYVTIRQARIFNDRNQVPLFKYEPLRSTAENRARCEVITDLVQQTATEYGYKSELKQAIFQALHYGYCLMFPQEEWHYEKEPELDGKEIKWSTKKEGIRHVMPHPGRTFWDLSHRVSTFNTDSGCEWAGYWSIEKYGNIKDNPEYYNVNKVSIGDTSWFTSNRTFFSTIYPCSIAFPERLQTRRVGAGRSDRENLSSFYTTNHTDKAILTTNMFMKINPKEYGISDSVDQKIWFRFVVASDNTVIHCSPVCYNPIIYIGYDGDENRAFNSSMSLEVLPFQDHIGNLVTQQILTVKQNLSSMVFYNKDVVDESKIRELKNIGEKRFRGPVYVPFSGMESGAAMTNEAQAIINVRGVFQSTSEIQQAVTTLISLLERVMVMSSQELAQSASHEQTAEETRTISGSTSTRLQFTASYVDEGIYTWKKQIYDGIMAYADDEIASQITIVDPITKEALEEVGFEIEGDGAKGSTVGLSGDKKVLKLEGFASTKDGQDRTNGTAVAASMVQLFQVFASQPELKQSVGVKGMVEMFNNIAAAAGMPRDFKLSVVNEVASPEDQQKELQTQLQQMGQQVMGATLQKVSEGMQPIAQAVKSLGEQSGQVQQAIQQLGQQGQEIAKKTIDIGNVTAAHSQQIGQLMQTLMSIAQSAPPLPQQAPDASMPMQTAPMMQNAIVPGQTPAL